MQEIRTADYGEFTSAVAEAHKAGKDVVIVTHLNGVFAADVYGEGEVHDAEADDGDDDDPDDES